MKLTKYLAVLCCGTLFAACENPIQHFTGNIT